MKKVTKQILQRALELAAKDYFRGCNLVPDQKDDLLQSVIDSWIEKANDSDTE
jgi:hypothetical protein